jgi:GNAT superfamily N-acetyltransferase
VTGVVDGWERRPRQWHIRVAAATDVVSLADLAKRSFVVAYGHDNASEDVRRYAADAFAPARIAAELASTGSWFLLAHEPDDAHAAPVAYARLLLAAHDLVGGRRPLQLERLSVAPERIGRGAGGALMAACLTHAAQLGCDRLWLGVWEHNTKAHGFYRRWGFRHVGDQSFVLGDDVQTDHVMARTLAG